MSVFAQNYSFWMNKNEDLFGCLLKKMYSSSWNAADMMFFIMQIRRSATLLLERAWESWGLSSNDSDEWRENSQARNRGADGSHECLWLGWGIYSYDGGEGRTWDRWQAGSCSSYVGMDVEREVKYYKKSDYHTPKGNWYGILSRFDIKSPSGIASQKQ